MREVCDHGKINSIMTIKTLTEIPHNIIDSNKSDSANISAPETDASNRLSHRTNSLFKELAAISPVAVENCGKDQFIEHLFGNQANSVLVSNDPNQMVLEPITNVWGINEYFFPILPPKGGVRTRSSFVSLMDVLKAGRYKYAVFEVDTDDMPEQFVREIELGSYPCAAVISIYPSVVHMVCRVDATSAEHYQDCCEAVLRVANDLMECNRAAGQLLFGSMPTREKGNLLYLNPKAQWRIPVPNKDGLDALT